MMLNIFSSSLVKYLYMPFKHFLKWEICFLIVEFWVFLVYSVYSLIYRYCPPILKLPFHSFNRVFLRAKEHNLMKSNVMNFSWCFLQISLFVLFLRILYITSGHDDFPLHFLLIYIYIYIYILHSDPWSIMSFILNEVQYLGSGSFFFSYKYSNVAIWFVKRLCFLHWIYLAPL